MSSLYPRALSDILHCLDEIRTWPEKLLPARHGLAKKFSGSGQDNLCLVGKGGFVRSLP